jgi:hypothetical protein
MTASTYGRQVTLALVNKSGGAVAAGDVVVIDTTNNEAFTTSTAGAFVGGVGIVQDTSIASNATGRVLTEGYASLVNVNASVTRGNFGKTHTVVKQATDAGANRGVGTFCQFLTGGTTPTALVYPVDLLGSSLTNPMNAVGDIIQGTTAGAAARLGAGTAGQFHMAAGAATSTLWASRELDYVEFTSSVSLTATTEATANTIVTGSAVAYDGSTAVIIEFFCQDIFNNTATEIDLIYLYDGASSIGRMGDFRAALGSTDRRIPCFLTRRLTPSNATHTYSIRGASGGHASASAGAGGNGNIMPGYIRITRAV